jgi:hypothetical protein
MEWLIAFSIVLPFFLIFLSIPSFIEVYKSGWKEYHKLWKSVSLLRRELNCCYKISKNKTLNYIYPDGRTKSVTELVTDYYYPIFKNGDVIIIQNSESSFSTIHVVFNRKVDGRWVENTEELKTSQCPWQQMCIDIVKKKLIKLRETSIQLESVNRLEEVIYSDLLERDRDNKIDLILND